MSVYADPLAISSNWMYCRACGVKGDTVEIFSKMRNLDTRLALTRAISDGLANGDVDLSAESVNSYLINYPQRRAENQSAWDKLHANLTDNIHPELTKRLQNEHLWGSYGRESERRFWQFLGGGMRKEVEKLFDGRSFLPDTGFTSCLSMNFQDVPGRTCCFGFRGDNAEMVYKFMVDPSHTKKDGGLAMLETLGPFEGVVYALGDPTMALNLQRIMMLHTKVPAKIVVFNEHTQSAWQSVHAGKVVFWDNQVTWRLFDQARKVQNSHVAISPRPRQRQDNLYAYIIDATAPGVLDIMNRSSEPWHLCFAKWLTNPEMPESEAREAVNMLALNTYDRSKVIEVCPTARKARLETLLGELKIQQKAVFNRHNVIEQENGWWISYSASSRELVSDAVIKIHREVCDKSSGKSFWSGHIKFRNKPIPFNDPLEVIEKDVEAWLRRYTIGEGLGTPIIKPTWVNHLLNIARVFSNPQAVLLEGQLGLQANGEFHLPRFKIADGRFIEKKGQLHIDMYPACDVVQPGKVMPLNQTGPACGVFAALTAAYMTNQVRRMRGLPPRPVGVVGSSMSTARVVMQKFAQGAGMHTHILLKVAATAMTRDKINEYDYPCYLEPNEPLKLSSYPPVSSDHTFIACETLEASALAAGGGWLLVHAPGTFTDQILPRFDDVLDYIASLQSRNFELKSDQPLATAILEDFCTWFGNGRGDKDKMLAAGRQALYTPSAGEALLDLTFGLIQCGRLFMEHEEFVGTLAGRDQLKPDKRGKILLDDIENKVLIPRHNLQVALRAQCLPVPDLAIPTADLNRQELLRPGSELGHGWVLEKEYWESRTQQWQWRGQGL